MSTKRISELPLMEEVTENLNILVEDDGETKRIPASSVGGGKEMVEKVLYEEAESVFTAADGMEGYISYMVYDPGFKFEEGKQYTFTIGEDVYTSVGRVYSAEGQSVVYVGNAGLLGGIFIGAEDTGEQFIIVAVAYGSTLAFQVIVPGEAGGYSIKVSTMVEKSSGMGAFVIGIEDVDGTLVLDKTEEEIAEAYHAGKLLICEMSGKRYAYSHGVTKGNTSVYVTFAGVNVFSGAVPVLEIISIKGITVTYGKYELTLV